MTDFLLNEEPIDPSRAVFDAGHGACVDFLGAVRGQEGGRPILGIDYTAYRPMAEQVLNELLLEGARRTKHQVYIQHRLGMVAVGEISLLIRVLARHSAEAFDLCQWYLMEIKTRVPVWKRAIESPR